VEYIQVKTGRLESVKLYSELNTWHGGQVGEILRYFLDGRFKFPARGCESSLQRLVQHGELEPLASSGLHPVQQFQSLYNLRCSVYVCIYIYIYIYATCKGINVFIIMYPMFCIFRTVKSQRTGQRTKKLIHKKMNKCIYKCFQCSVEILAPYQLLNWCSETKSMRKEQKL